jgi:hypothetical protein
MGEGPTATREVGFLIVGLTNRKAAPTVATRRLNRSRGFSDPFCAGPLPTEEMMQKFMATTAAATLFSSAVFAQQPNQSTASIPDFSGIWAHPYVPGFEPPASGAGPVVNKSRMRAIFGDDGRPLPATTNLLVSNGSQLVGDYANPILKAEAAEVVKKHGEISIAGVAYPTPSNQCWPGGVPFIFWNFGMQMLQQPDKITILYSYDHEFRQVRMNEPHLAQVTPSWYGDSVGHYEGDMVVIDTVGIKVGPFAMVDQYGTPHTVALHVVERYRLLDYEDAKEGWERNAKENLRIPSSDVSAEVDPAYTGKALQLEFTVEDEGVFTRPWSATITYRRALDESMEIVCAENTREAGQSVRQPPRAAKPDF